LLLLHGRVRLADRAVAARLSLTFLFSRVLPTAAIGRRKCEAQPPPLSRRSCSCLLALVGLHITSARLPRSCATPCSLRRSSSQQRGPSSSRTAARGHRRDLCRLKRADIAHSSFFCPSCRALRVLRVRECIGSLLELMGVSLLPRSPFRSPSNERTRLGLGSEQTDFAPMSRIDAYARLLRCRGVNGRRHGGHSTLAVHPSKLKLCHKNFVSEMPR